MDEELKGIVQRMIDAGESEANIALVIQSWNSKKKSNAGPSGQDSASGAQTSTAPLRTFQAPDVPDINVGDIGSSLRQPATFGDMTQAASQRLSEQEAVQARVQQEMPYLQEDPARGAIPTPLTPEGQQQYVQETLIPHIEEQEQKVQDFNRNLQAIREQNRAAGYFTDQDRVKFREQAIERINNDMASQHKNASFLTRNIINPASDLFSSAPIRALANAGAGLIGLPEMANDVLASAFSGIIEMAGGPENAVPTWNETYGDTPLDQISDYIREATTRQRDLLEKKYGEGGTWEQVKKGNINGAIGHIANGVGETAPLMAMYALTGGWGAGTQTAAGTALFGSQTYQDLQDSDVAPELKLANSLVGGLAEGFFEQVGTGWLFNTARNVLRTAGKEQAENFLKDSIEKTLKRAYEKYYVVSAPAGEILTEGATLVTQNFMDQITGVDPERGLLDGWQDTAILAAAASAPISTPTAAIRSIRDKKNRKEAEGLMEYNNGIIEALQNENINVEEKAALFERYQNNTQKINQYIEQEQEWRGKLTERQRAMVEELERRQSEIDSLMQNESLPDSARAGLEQEQANLDEQMDEIVEETSKTVDSSDFSPETQDRIRDMTFRIDEINSEIRRMRNEGTLTPEVEAPLVLERRQLQDELNQLEPDAQPEATTETTTDETIAEPIEESVVEPVGPTVAATEEVVETQPRRERSRREPVEKPVRRPTEETSDPVSDLIDTEVEYRGEYGMLEQDGQQLIVRLPRNEEGVVRELEVGNIEDLSSTPANEVGINPVVSEVSINDEGVFSIRNREYVNPSENPVEAINYNEDGGIQSVTLATPDGRKRTFRGNTAEDIAYQIHLNEITKDNEKTARFEEFINQPEVAEEIVNAGLSEAAETEANTVNGTIQQESGQLTAEGQPTTDASQAVQVSDAENPQRAAQTLQDSYNRLTEGMTPEQIESDPDLARMRDRIGQLTGEQQTQEETQDAIQIGETAEVPLGEPSGNRAEVEREVREQATTEEGQIQGQVDETAETAQQKTPAKPATKKPKKAPSFKEILTDAGARQNRASELLERINKYRSSRPEGGLGLAKDSRQEARYWRDITDYAIIRLVDGAITTVDQLAKELGIKTDNRLRQAFRDARAEIDADPDLATTTGRNLDTAKKRRNYGFDERLPVEREPTKEVMDKAKQELQDGYPIEDLFARIDAGAGATSLETAILMQYSAAQEAEVLRQGDEIERTKDSRYAVVNEHIDARERAMNNLLRAYNALEQSGTANARAMNIRKQLVQWDFSLAGMIAQRRRAIGYDTVSPAQMREIEREFRRMQDIIDKIRERNELLEQEMTRLEAENAILKVKKEHAEKQGRKNKPKTEQIQDIRERRKAALDDIREIWAEMTSPGFAYDPKKDAARHLRLTKAILNLAQTYLEEGITGAGEIVDKIHSAISAVAPGITRQQVTAAIAGTDRESRPQLSDIQRAMRDLRLELRLLEDIERLEKGVDRIKEPRALEIRNARIEDLRARLRELRQSQREQGSQEQDNLEKAKKATKARIKEYQRRINEKDYAPKVPNLIEEDAELKNLRKQLKKIRFDFQVESKKFELQRRSKWKKGMDLAIDILNVPRALMATADLSAPLRQGIFVLASRPILSARAFASMLQFARSKQTYEDYMLDFIESPGYDLAMKAGLSITDVSSNPEVTAREEQFMSNIASQLLKNMPIIGESKRISVKNGTIKIPGLDIHGGAERAYNGYLNKLRIDMFERGVEQLQNAGYSSDQNPGAYRELAKYINAATGRGPLPDSLKLSTAALSSLLFSPRLIASRLYLLAGGPLYTAPAPVRKMYIQDAVSFVAFGMAVLALGKLAGADSEDDPRSSDFGKMRFGDDRYDIWGGFTQYVTFLSRMFTGERVTTTGRVRKLDGSEYDKMTRGDLAMRFVRSKLSPTAAFATSAMQNSNYMGEPFDVWDELINMSYPLVAQDIIEAWDAKGPTAALAPGIPIILGVGFQSYGANDFLKKGVDGALIDLLNEKKAATMTPEMQDVKVYEPGRGERNITGEEYRRYTKYWADYIKSDLTNNMAEYRKMGPNTFDKKYQAVKAAATSYAKQQITGVSSHDLTIRSDNKTYRLTPEQVEIRLNLMNQYKDRYGHRIYRDRDKYKRRGMSDEMALMQAKKDFASEARSDSRDKMLQMQRRGEIELTEGLED